MEFVQTQKNNQKSLAAKYGLTDSYQKQQFTLMNFFRNKFSREKVQKFKDQASRSKVQLEEEIKALTNWLNDYDKYS